MCGIFGYTGKKEAMDILTNGLAQLEYRGYDSAGICMVNDDHNLYIIKAVGRVMELKNKTN